MKLMPRFINSFYFVITLLLAAIIAIYVSCPKLLVNFAYINWLALLMLIILLISPLGKLKFTEKSNSQIPLSPTKWLSQIILLQIALLLVFVGLTELMGSILPIDTETHTATLLPALQDTFLNFGLYPWALIAMFAAAFGIACYAKNQNSYLSTISGNFTQKKYEIFNITANLAGRAATTTLIGLSFVTATFLIASLITSPQDLRGITGFSVAAIGTSFLLLFLFLRRKVSAILSSVETHRPALGIFLNMLIFAIIISLIALVIHYIGTGDNQMPLFFATILAKGWQLHWQLVYTLFWLITVPISAILIAKFSQGYSLRAMLLASMLLPVILAIVLLSIKLLQPQLILHLPKIVAVLLGIAGFVLLIFFLFNKNHLPSTIQCYLPKSDSIKSRNKELFSQRWKRMCGLVFYLFIPAGVFVIAIMLSLLIVPMVLIICGVIYSLARSIAK